MWAINHFVEDGQVVNRHWSFTKAQQDRRTDPETKNVVRQALSQHCHAINKDRPDEHRTKSPTLSVARKTCLVGLSLCAGSLRAGCRGLSGKTFLSHETQVSCGSLHPKTLTRKSTRGNREGWRAGTMADTHNIRASSSRVTS